MKALKALVAGMGLLIVIGIGLVGYGLTREKQKPQAQTQMQQVTISVHEPFRVTVPVSPGSKLEQVTATGNRIVLRFSTPNGDVLTLYDAETGHPTGSFTLVPESH